MNKVLAGLEPADNAMPQSREETDTEHIARDIREGRFPAMSERQMIVETPAPDAVARLVEAARALITGANTTYRARNGRQIGIEADDGEMCFIVHSDLIHAIETALAAMKADHD